MNDFDTHIAECCGHGLLSEEIATIQVNLGFMCNQRCRHCHLSASPERTEIMTWETMSGVLCAAQELECVRFDLTGGAPELNPHFRRFVAELRGRGHDVQVRTNLTVLLERGMEDLPVFLHEKGMRLAASLPCYLEENVNAQRGAGVYSRSIEALRRLNAIGYGTASGLQLNLVYNPAGPFLPPEQSGLEHDYRAALWEQHGVEFSNLLTITNMPIGRFMADLEGSREAARYLALLKESFNCRTVEALMCRHQLSVGWDGTLHDCDFNLALGWPVDHGAPRLLRDFDVEVLRRRRIVTGEHCFGCTAGAGSSCGGALA